MKNFSPDYHFERLHDRVFADSEYGPDFDAAVALMTEYWDIETSGCENPLCENIAAAYLEDLHNEIDSICRNSDFSHADVRSEAESIWA